MLPKLVWRASPNCSARNARVDLLVLHDCEGSYQGSIAYFETRASEVSAHYVCKEDGSEVTGMVELADKAWHACEFNSRSVGWEMAGYAKNGFSETLLNATANAFAWLCHHLQIPARHARGGVGPGIESHWGLGTSGGGHSDPSRDPAFMDGFVAPRADSCRQGRFSAPMGAGEGPTALPTQLALPRTLDGPRRSVRACFSRLPDSGRRAGFTCLCGRGRSLPAPLRSDGRRSHRPSDTGAPPCGIEGRLIHDFARRREGPAFRPGASTRGHCARSARRLPLPQARHRSRRSTRGSAGDECRDGQLDPLAYPAPRIARGHIPTLRGGRP